MLHALDLPDIRSMLGKNDKMELEGVGFRKKWVNRETEEK